MTKKKEVILKTRASRRSSRTEVEEVDEEEERTTILKHPARKDRQKERALQNRMT
jgi:hypothetical protein